MMYPQRYAARCRALENGLNRWTRRRLGIPGPPSRTVAWAVRLNLREIPSVRRSIPRDDLVTPAPGSDPL